MEEGSKFYPAPPMMYLGKELTYHNIEDLTSLSYSGKPTKTVSNTTDRMSTRKDFPINYSNIKRRKIISCPLVRISRIKLTKQILIFHLAQEIEECIA